MAENILENEDIILRENAYELSDDEMIARIVTLGFDGDRELFERFRATLKTGLPPGTGVALRGSVVTNERHADGTPFDSKGEGTSDLDVTLIGEAARALWNDDEYYIPALHTKPLGDKAPDIAAPELNSLRETAQKIVGRPVNMQATADIILYARDVLFGEPYHMIIELEEKTAEN